MSLFMDQYKKVVKEFAPKTAFVDKDGKRSLTYGEFDHMVDKMAGYLIRKGCVRGDMVIVGGSRKVEYLAAEIALFQIGCVAVPVMNTYPQERIRLIQQDCSAKLILTDDMMEDAVRSDLELSFNQNHTICDEDMAMIIYTSGSTGKPKGVVHTAKSFYLGLQRNIKCTSMDCNTRFLHMSPFTFVSTPAFVFSCLAVGATVVLMPEQYVSDIRRIEAYIEDMKITHVFISPQILQSFQNKSKTLQTVITGSDKVSRVCGEGYQLLNTYGLSETMACFTAYGVDKKYDLTPIGTSVGVESKLYLVDEAGKEIKGEGEGEICVSGVISSGYFNNPEETNRAFIKNPFDDGYPILFHTNDIAKRLPDGTLVFVNRKDWMVKINGQRVEIGEVESILKDADGIENAVVKAFENEYQSAYLCAYYKANRVFDQEELKDILSKYVPDYMIPSFFVKLEKIPLNANGKLDRKSLKAPDASLYRTEYVAPVNETQERLCQAFEETLQCGKVGICDNFFSLGGNSINVLKLIERSQITGLTPNMVFTGKTPKDIAEAVVVRTRDIYENCHQERAYYPLTDSQMGVYLECCENPESTMYNIPILYKGDVGVDPRKLVNAIRTAIKNHPLMNVRISDKDGTPVMVKTDRKCNVEIVNLTGEEVMQYAKDFVKPFDFEKELLYRAVVICTELHIYFCLDFHHMIFDGTSYAVLLDEIRQVYEGGELKEEEISLFDISIMEENVTDTEEYKRGIEFFSEKFDGVEVDSNLIPDAEYIENHSDEELGVWTGTLLGETSNEKIRDFLRKNSITENSLFMSAFAYTLALFTGQSEAVFCTVNNGRHDVRLKNTIGMLVRTLPMYVKIEDNQTSTEFMTGIQDDFMETMSHDICRFSELANRFGINSDTMFVYQSDMLNGVNIANCAFEAIHLQIEPQSNLAIMLFQNKGSYEMRMEYRADLYSQKLMEAFAETMDCVLKCMLNNEVLSCMEIISNEQKAVLDDFNNTEDEYDCSKSMVDLLREQMIRVPDKIAVVYKDKIITYRELDDITEKIGACIHKMGIGKEDVVSVLIPRNEYMPIASIGVLKSGAAYQPLDPTYPMDRLAFMMKDADAKLLIADEDMLKLVPEYKGEVLFTKDIPLLPESDMALPCPKPEDLFIMLYTSGSTGVPKGCQLEHRNLVAYCHMHYRILGMTENSRASAYASYGFDANMHETYPTLAIGATLYIIDDEIRFDLSMLNQYFEENQITQAFMTTQIARQFAVSQENHSLECLIAAGEKLVALNPPINYKMFNLYGPTENTIFVNYFHVDKKYEDIPIGKTVTNVKEYVIDKFGRRLPVGAIGELCSSGMQTARGYLNRPEQTEAAFTKNPFTDQYPYGRFYHTGDIVRYLSDGNVQFVGRRDGQVKVRGFRIELTEVEEVIREYPDIKDATVAAFDEPSGGKYVAAYIVSDKTINIDDLNSFIMDKKPPYMVPAVTMQIDKIPLNQNQKVNKRALPIPERKMEEIVPPENETQQKILDVVAEVIGHDQFGITTDIYMAGLTSIGAVKLNVMLAKAFDVTMKIKDLKENPTVKQLERLMLGSVEDEEFAYQADYPITQTQQGIFVECMAHPRTTIYNIPALYKMDDSINVDRLAQSVKKAVNAHAYIKGRIFMNDQGDIRIARNDEELPVVEVINEEPVLDQLSTIYNVVGDRLYTIRIYHTESGKYLFVEMHHIICDGTSLGIFLKDIECSYQGKELENEKYSGFELALDEEKMIQGAEYKRAEAFYDSFLTGVETEFLPEKDYEPDGTGRGMCLLQDESLESAQEYCKKNSLTMNGLFMSAFGYLIGKYVNKEEALFTTIYHGRNDSRKYNTVSMLVKTFPIYIKTDSKVLDLCKNISKQYADSMVNDIFSFAQICHKYGVKNDIMFAYQGDNFTFDTFDGKASEEISMKLDEAKAPLNLNVVIRNGKLEYILEYRKDMYCKESMENLIRYYKKVVSEFLIKETTGDIELLDEQATEEMRRFNDTEEAVENVTTVTLFERQVQKNPKKTACICDGKSLTYEELNCLANKVAHTLIAAGAKPDDMIGAIIPRFIYAYAVREGILKSGAALMPVDPNYPDDRMEYIFQNSGANKVVTTEKIAAERKDFFISHGIEVFVLEEIFQAEDSTNPTTMLTPQNLCYCIYTSGSTGKPKGVMIEHHSLVNFVAYNRSNDQSAEYVENMSVSLALAAFTFDVSVLEEALPLYHGATVAIATEKEIHNPYALADMMIRTGVDVMKCTPSFMLSIVDEPYVQKALQHLKALDIGAEAFPANLYTKLRNAGITAKIHNGYGPTEATITTSIDVVKDSRVTIGRPLCNTKVYMLDRYNHMMPVGIPGELVVCGECVGRGYIGMPEMNKEKFITINGRPAYRSGDYAKWLSDGRIGFIGRTDNQVKLRGLRVELDEIENAMNTYPSIKRSVVLVKENENGQYLCAYFTASEPIDTESLKMHMSKTLTSYMIPGVFVPLETMPMNPNGKVDKKALPEPEAAVTKLTGKAPRTELEKKLCNIFQSAIGISQIGLDDDFFEMGGTSLSASKVAMRCMMEQIPIVYANVFQYKTVEALAAFVESEQAAQYTLSQSEHCGSKESAENRKTSSFGKEYEKAESMLVKNTVEYIDEVHSVDIGNVLLTGATGFLGIHVLKKLLETDVKKIYCLVRGGRTGSSTKHLQTLLMYYFDDTFDQELEKRITIISGDITDANLKDVVKDYDFDTVINCAACVKHFVKDDLLERVNVQGVQNLIAVCKQYDKRLVQISTVSVAGMGIEGEIPFDKKIQENELYFGQNLDNQYINTKFRAEKYILEAAADGLKGKVIRVGNLMSRYEDGEFQANYHTNGFMNRLRAYAAVGEFPVYAMDAGTEFSPIDKTAEAIIKLVGTPDQFTVFHAYNCHSVHMANVLDAMRECGIDVKPVKMAEFQNTFEKKMADEKTSMLVSALVSYMNNDKTMFLVPSENTFTTKALYGLGFSWPLIDERYLKNAIRALATLGFFED